MFRKIEFECAHDGDIVFTLQCWGSLRVDGGLYPHTVEEFLEGADPYGVVNF